MMKHEPKPCLTETEDDDFLSQVAAVEADALSNKRRKITPASGGSSAAPKEECNGLYMAALKGNNTLPLVPRSSAQGRDKVVTVAGENGAIFSGGCFKCGNLGHWARDCVEAGSAGGGGAGGYVGNFRNDESVAEKPCPCGLGACLVLTANTERNRGRKFYRCPLRQENGGCKFFEWCDSTAGTTINGGSHTVESYSWYPHIQCPCGAPDPCQILTARTGKNIGQQFYRCPLNRESSCGFFKWCNEVAAGFAESGGSYKSSSNMGDKNKPSSDLKSGSACFRCGKDGHWAKDCSITSASYCAAEGKRSASSGSCYKCNKPGHWARDCPSS
ncbi:hypothetical protein L6164_008538 [Bauhinia variegata]|uniref:Uncharacterized protein n=1 Tax=Bauhinia variegata TaxID=167791 RepID=A0ACB9PG73_BAUVA|nr:hypothetical protein L6164_008538 [Bauhinia variegata]